MPIRFTPLPTPEVRALQAGGPDAHGLTPERRVAEAAGIPCRRCLGLIPDGAPMPVPAHRPFPTLQPHAETGPVFRCADPCAAGGGARPPAMPNSPDHIVQGYRHDDRIVRGTGAEYLQPGQDRQGLRRLGGAPHHDWRLPSPSRGGDGGGGFH